MEENSDNKGAAAHCLKLPGKHLYLTPLLKQKKFRNYGSKSGALAAFEELQSSELGKIVSETQKSLTVSYYVLYNCIKDLVGN